jgi:hypothetical protein
MVPPLSSTTAGRSIHLLLVSDRWDEKGRPGEPSTQVTDVPVEILTRATRLNVVVSPAGKNIATLGITQARARGGWARKSSVD